MTQSFFDEDEDRAVQTLAIQLCREYGINPNWVLHDDQDAPLRSCPPPEWTPVFAMGSVHPKTGCWRFETVEHIALASHLLSPSRFVTRMDSRSLEPRIRQGAYLVVDTAQDQVPEKPAPGIPFAIDVQGEGLVVRMTRYERQADSLELTGIEPGTPAVFVPCAASDSRVVGRVVWVAQAL